MVPYCVIICQKDYSGFRSDEAKKFRILNTWWCLVIAVKVVVAGGVGASQSGRDTQSSPSYRAAGTCRRRIESSVADPDPGRI